ncbi:MAG: hypothetical protein LBT83_11345 [Tannerella sp.]|jgi:hypothetical protein|nr:hypothetical protein [Tannerella sp.]
MKKYLVLWSLLALTFTACEGPVGPPGEGGLEVSYHTIRTRDWQLIGGTQDVSFYRCLVDLNIGDDIYEYGNISVFLYLMDDRNEVQAPLPYSIPRVDGSIRWDEQYSFDFDSGTISFYADYLRGETPPEKEFRVVLTW